MKQNEYYINPNGFADPNDKFVCYSHRTKKVTVHCADGLTHPSAHTYDTIKQIMARSDNWQKVDYKTAYSLLKPLDKTEILHYYVPTTKNPRNNIELISCNKITKKSTVYYKNGRLDERDNYARCGKLKLVSKQDALNIIKNINRSNYVYTDIKFDNPLKDEIKEDEIVYYGPNDNEVSDWYMTAYVEYNKTKKEIVIILKTGENFIPKYITVNNLETYSKDWKIITKDEALTRLNVSNVFSNEQLDQALRMFFSNATVPYDQWNVVLKQSYRKDMMRSLSYLNPIVQNSIDNLKSDV